MQEIRCPKCGEVFQVDETGYQQIVQQVRDQEFEKELKRREEELNAKRQSELELIKLQEERQHDEAIAKKERELSAKDQEIADLQARIERDEVEKELAISKAVQYNALHNLKITF